MKPETLQHLLAGNFICQFAFPEAYEDLSTTGAHEQVDTWLASLDRRLARLGDDGAFYVAPLQVHRNEDVNKVRADLSRFRDSHGLLTQILNLVRLAKDGFRGVPGEFVQLAELVLRVNEDSTLVAQLRELRIPGADTRWSNHDLLRRMLEKLRADGYLILSNEASETQRNLARVALWLSKNRLSEGFELDLTPEDAAPLHPPLALATTWNIDVSDTDEMVSTGILAAAKRLPSAVPPKRPDAVAPPVVVSTTQEVVQPPSAPIDELIDAYLDFISSDAFDGGGADLSLLRWRERMGQAYGLETDTTDEEWLLYACSQVSSAGYAVDLEVRARAPGEYNDYFNDAAARRGRLTNT